MPESSFFDPMQMGPGMGDFPAPGKPKPPTYLPDPRVTAGYQNVYGTRFGVSASPVTQRASLDAQVPIGDHQRQLFLQGSAYAQPGQGTGAPSDWGFRLGVSKKIEPQGMSGGQAINQALQQNLDASTRSQLLNTFTPEQLQLLGQDVRRIQRADIDARLGIQEGAEKYGFGFGVDIPHVRQSEDDTARQPNSTDFARQYAGRLQQTGTFADPNMQQGPSTPGTNPDAEPKWDPYSGALVIKTQPRTH